MRFSREEYESFVADEAPAIDQLRLLAGGQVSAMLDGSVGSVATLDRFVENMRAMPGWPSPAALGEIAPDMRSWLATRIGYYLAAVLRQRFGFRWEHLSDESSRLHGQPVMVLGELRFSPIEVGVAHVQGELEGGLQRLVGDVERKLHLS